MAAEAEATREAKAKVIAGKMIDHML